nr:histone deacetylase family protein [uncultured Devosia sp.]
MKVFINKAHLLHEARAELVPGKFVSPIEVPNRVTSVADYLTANGLGGHLEAPPAHPDDLLSVHDAGYLSFLERAWGEWAKVHGDETDGLAFVWPHRNRPPRIPQAIEGQLGYYMFDGVSPITPHAWAASLGAAGAARAAADHLAASGESAFALVRPPGHHACHDMGGGTSYLNNSAIAAAHLARQGARVAMLDIDAHHGNGAQDIFWSSPDMLTISIHCDPAADYPYFSGYADETGAGPGEGLNINLPLAVGSQWEAYLPALEQATRRIGDFAPDFLVVPLGVDAHRDDPSGKLALETADYSRIGDAIAALSVPSMFVLEGGYDPATMGESVLRTLAASVD